MDLANLGAGAEIGFQTIIQAVAGFFNQHLQALLHETPGDDVGPREHVSGLPIYRHDHDEDAVLGEVLAVAQDAIANVAHAEAVHIHVPRLRPAHFANVGLAELDDVAVFRDDDVLGVHAEFAGQTARGA